MQGRIKRVAGAPIFAVARTDRLPASFYAGFKNSPQLEQLARSIRGLTLAGQPSGNDVNVALDAECDSMTNAIKISTLIDTFRMVGSMALHDPKMRGQMTREQAVFLSCPSYPNESYAPGQMDAAIAGDYSRNAWRWQAASDRSRRPAESIERLPGTLERNLAA